MQTLARIATAVAVIAIISMPAAVLAQGTDDAKAKDQASTSDTASSDKQATEAKAKKTKPKMMTRQQEIDRSIDSGTVPARYRSRVPKQYHQYIPFAK
jgi:hypothetical protein